MRPTPCDGSAHNTAEADRCFLAQQGKIIGGKVLLVVDIPDVLLIHNDAAAQQTLPCAVLFQDTDDSVLLPICTVPTPTRKLL